MPFLKILFVNPSYLPDAIGGGQLHIHYLARALRRRGHRTFLVRRATDPERPEFAVCDVPGADMPARGINYNFRDCTSYEFIYENAAIDASFASILDELQPDLVHVHHLTCLSTGMLDVLRARDIPSVLTLHDFWLGCPRGQRLQDDLSICETIDRTRCLACCRKLWPTFFPDDEHGLATFARYDEALRRRLNAVDALVCPSHFVADRFRRDGFDARRMHVVENGLPHDLFRGSRVRPVRDAASPLHVAFIGSVIPSKGVHVLIDAVQRLDPERIELAIHGEHFPWHLDTTYRERLDTRIRGTHRITFTGRYENDQVPKLLARADVVVVPGLWYEAFCLTIREAFLAKVPVVASRLGAMEEAIEDGVTGCLFEPGNVDELTRILQELLDHPERLQSLATTRKHVVSINGMTDELLALYHRTIHGRSRAHSS